MGRVWHHQSSLYTAGGRPDISPAWPKHGFCAPWPASLCASAFGSTTTVPLGESALLGCVVTGGEEGGGIKGARGGGVGCAVPGCGCAEGSPGCCASATAGQNGAAQAKP